MFPLPPRLSAPLSFPDGPATGPFAELPVDPTGEIVKLVARDAAAIHALSQTCRYFHAHTSKGRKETLLDASLAWTMARRHTMPTSEALWRFDAVLHTLGQSGDWLSPQGKVPRLKQLTLLIPSGPAFISCSARFIAHLKGFDSASKTLLATSMLKSHRKRFPGSGVSMRLLQMVASAAGGQASEDAQFQRLFVDIHTLRSSREKQIERFDDVVKRVFAAEAGRCVALVVELLKLLDLRPFEENCDSMVSTLSDAIARHASRFSLGELNRFGELLPDSRPEEVDPLFASLLLPRLDISLADWASTPVGERGKLMRELLRVMQFVDDRLEEADGMEPRRARVLALWLELASADAPSLTSLAVRVLMKGATCDAFVAWLVGKCRVEPALCEQVLLQLHRGVGFYDVRQQVVDALLRADLPHGEAARLRLLTDALRLQISFKERSNSVADLCRRARQTGGAFGEAILADIAAMMQLHEYGNPEACAELPPELGVQVLFACIQRRMFRECGEDGLSTLLPLLQALSSLPAIVRGDAFSHVAQGFGRGGPCHPSFLPSLPDALLALAEKTLPGEYLGPVLLSMSGAVKKLGQGWHARLLAACDLLPVGTRKAWKLACSAKAVDVHNPRAARKLDELELQVRQLPEKHQQVLAQQLIEAKREELPKDEDED